jgi:hypothetical protein
MDSTSFKSKNFTEDGIKSMSILLDNFINIFNDKRYLYPLKMNFYGFPVSQFDSEGDLYGRIKLLSDMLGNPIKIQFKEEELEALDGTKYSKINCYIEKETQCQ